MADDADVAASRDEAAMALFEESQRQARIASSLRVFDPSLPVQCVDCGSDVPEARLRAYPRTRRCVDCAAEVERHYRERSR